MNHPVENVVGYEADELDRTGNVTVTFTTDMIEACRETLEEWGAFEWGRTGPSDELMSWALEAAFRAAGFSVQNPLGPEPDD